MLVRPLLLVCLLAGCGGGRGGATPAAPLDAGGTQDADAGEDTANGAALADVAPADAGNVGCHPWFHSDHNGCYELPTKPINDRCDPQRRAALLDGVAIEDLDGIAPQVGRPGQRQVKERRLLVRGTAALVAPGRVEVQPAEGGAAPLVVHPGLPAGEVPLLQHGEEVELEYLESVREVTDRRGEVVLREDRSFLLRLSAADGTLAYAAGDPFVPVRTVEANLQALGLEIAPTTDPVCGYAEYDGIATPVGWCLVYRRNVGYDVALPGGAPVTVVSGEEAEVASGDRRYRVENGDSYLVEDSHDDCNVPGRTELRITRLR